MPRPGSTRAEGAQREGAQHCPVAEAWWARPGNDRGRGERLGDERARRSAHNVIELDAGANPSAGRGAGGAEKARAQACTSMNPYLSKRRSVRVRPASISDPLSGSTSVTLMLPRTTLPDSCKMKVAGGAAVTFATRLWAARPKARLRSPPHPPARVQHRWLRQLVRMLVRHLQSALLRCNACPLGAVAVMSSAEEPIVVQACQLESSEAQKVDSPPDDRDAASECQRYD